jgi:hypothetical protein
MLNMPPISIKMKSIEKKYRRGEKNFGRIKIIERNILYEHLNEIKTIGKIQIIEKTWENF